MTRVVLLIALVTATAFAQGAQAPTRDQTRVSFSGTARLTGTVVLDDDKRPALRGATVTLVRDGVEDMRVTSSDEGGRFSFDSLPAGAYMLSASKGGHITMSFGAPKPSMPGRTIVLADGQTYSAAPIALMKGAVIAGRVFDRAGRPVSNISVQAIQFLTVGTERRRRQGVGAFGASVTNEHGEFRVFGLLPGEYLLVALTFGTDRRIDVTTEELAWSRNLQGQPPRESRPYGVVQTWFPGVTDASAAMTIGLARGEERLGADFALQTVPVGRVMGTVVGSDGVPVAGVTITRMQVMKDEFLLVGGETAGTDREGRFVMMAVPPGQHLLTARSGRAGPPIGEAARPGLPAPQSLWGMADLNVTGADVSDLTIRMQPGMTLSGQVVVSPASTSGVAPDLGRMRLQLIPAAGQVHGPQPGSTTTEPDGRFKLEGVAPGRFRVFVAAPSAWFLRSAMYDGKDILDEPFEVRPGEDIAGITVTLTTVRSQFSGVITDGSGRPASDLYVFVFSTNPVHWLADSRRIMSARAREDGSYVIDGVPRGEYYLCALTELDTTLRFDPGYLQELAKASIKLTIADGEKKIQNLRIGTSRNTPIPR